jgi:hypothetical protein
MKWALRRAGFGATLPGVLKNRGSSILCGLLIGSRPSFFPQFCGLLKARTLFSSASELNRYDTGNPVPPFPGIVLAPFTPLDSINDRCPRFLELLI